MLLTRTWGGLAGKHGLKLRLHDAPHSHASALLMAGENIVLVSRRLGYSKIATTADTYGHLFPGQQRDAAERFAKLMNAARVQSVSKG